jgi:hypothetical protein
MEDTDSTISVASPLVSTEKLIFVAENCLGQTQVAVLLPTFISNFVVGTAGPKTEHPVNRSAKSAMGKYLMPYDILLFKIIQ